MTLSAAPIAYAPRKSVPARQPTFGQRLRVLLTSPNAIRTASVAVPAKDVLEARFVEAALKKFGPYQKQ